MVDYLFKMAMPERSCQIRDADALKHIEFKICDLLEIVAFVLRLCSRV